MIEIQASDFTKVPGPRYRSEGRHSGEEFRDTVLRPKFELARQNGEKLVVNLDGVRFGYPTSFLEESFGGLARIVGIETALTTLEFRSTDEPLLVDEVRRYIRDAHKTSKERAALA